MRTNDGLEHKWLIDWFSLVLWVDSELVKWFTDELMDRWMDGDIHTNDR